MSSSKALRNVFCGALGCLVPGLGCFAVAGKTGLILVFVKSAENS